MVVHTSKVQPRSPVLGGWISDHFTLGGYPEPSRAQIKHHCLVSQSTSPWSNLVSMDSSFKASIYGSLFRMKLYKGWQNLKFGGVTSHNNEIKSNHYNFFFYRYKQITNTTARFYLLRLLFESGFILCWTRCVRVWIIESGRGFPLLFCWRRFRWVEFWLDHEVL